MGTFVNSMLNCCMFLVNSGSWINEFTLFIIAVDFCNVPDILYVAFISFTTLIEKYKK